MKSLEKDWYSAKELEKKAFPDLPKQATNITRKVLNEDWKKRNAVGVKGGGYEYHVSSFPRSGTKGIRLCKHHRSRIHQCLRKKMN